MDYDIVVFLRLVPIITATFGAISAFILPYSDKLPDSGINVVLSLLSLITTVLATLLLFIIDCIGKFTYGAINIIEYSFTILITATFMLLLSLNTKKILKIAIDYFNYKRIIDVFEDFGLTDDK